MTSGNATKSARDAGYSEKGAEMQGYRMLRNVGVVAFLDSLHKELDAKEQAIFRSLVTRVNNVTKAAEETGDTNQALKGLDQLAKLGGKYTDAGQVQDKPTFGGIVINMPGSKVQVLFNQDSKEELTPK